MLFRNLFLICALFGFGSCAHYHYTPNLVSTPFITEKNEISASAYMGDVAFSGVTDLQLAYNPIKNVSLFTNLLNLKGRYDNGALSSEPDAEGVHHFYWEGGAGAKFPFKADKRFMLGLFAGGGTGKVDNNYGSGHYTRLNFDKLFVQPTFIFKGNILNLGIAWRYAKLAFRQGSVDLSVPDSAYRAIKNIEQDSPMYLGETGINIGLHFAPVTWNICMVKSNVLGVDNDDKYHFDLDNISVGLTLDVNQLFNKSEKRKKARQSE